MLKNLLLSLILLICPIIKAQVLPNAPTPVADKKFIALTSLNVAATVADIEITQKCIAAGTCREGNPLLSDSRVRMYSVDMGLVGLETVVSYYEKKTGHKYWWLAPTISIGTHTFAATYSWSK